MNQYNSNLSNQIIAGTYLTILILYIIILALGIICWLVEAFAMYRLAKRANEDSPWLAFIPFAHAYQKITLPASRPFDIFSIIHTFDRTTVAIFYLIAPLISTFLGCLPFLGYLLSLVYVILMAVVRWRINYDLYWVFGNKDKAMLFSILGLFIPFFNVVYLLVISFSDNYNVDEDFE